MTKKSVQGKFPPVDPDKIPLMKKFVLQRMEDESGNSGIGNVAVGCLFPSGLCVMEWNTVIKSVCFYNSIADLEAIHGHNGKTKVVWIE